MRKELVKNVHEATKIVFDASHLKESLHPFFAAIAESQKVFNGVVAAAKLLTPLRPNATPPAPPPAARVEPPTPTPPAPPPAARVEPPTPTPPAPPPAARVEPPTPTPPATPPAARVEPVSPAKPTETRPEPRDEDALLAAWEEYTTRTKPDSPAPQPQPQKQPETKPTATKQEPEQPFWRSIAASISNLVGAKDDPEPAREPRPKPLGKQEIAVKVDAPKQTPEDEYLFGREKLDNSPNPKQQEPEKPKPHAPVISFGLDSISKSISGEIRGALSSVASLFSKRDNTPKPEPTAAKTDDQSNSRRDRSLDEPRADTSRNDEVGDETRLAQIDRNTDPEHLETAADRIVKAIESVWAENEKTKQIAEQTGNANESLHDNTPSRIETPADPLPASPIENRPEPPSKQTPEDEFLFGREDSQEVKPKSEGDGGGVKPPGLANKALDAVKADIPVQAGARVEGAAVAEEAAVATEGSAAMEAAASRAAQALARIGPALGPVAVAAGVVVGSLAAVAAAGYLVYKAFDAIGDAAAKQADELAGYSADIAKQRAETDVRRQMRLIDRANERGETLARVGDAKDRLDEAINNLGDRVTDQFVDLADRLLPAVELLIGGINTTANFVETIGTSCGVIEATVIDWLNLLGDEAAEDAKWRDANEKHMQKVDKLMGRQDARERRREEKEFKDPLLNLLHNAMGAPRQMDPALMQQLIAQARGL